LSTIFLRPPKYENRRPLLGWDLKPNANILTKFRAEKLYKETNAKHNIIYPPDLWLQTILCYLKN